MDQRNLLSASNQSGANFGAKYISAIFSERRPCCLVEGLLHSVYKEIIYAMFITQIINHVF